jgi:hypothetical protein
MTPALQLRAQFLEIVDLAIENDPYLLLAIRHGLVPARQINDRKAPETESQRAGRIIAIVIRPSMRDRIRHSLDRFRIHWFLIDKIKLPTDSTHIVCPCLFSFGAKFNGCGDPYLQTCKIGGIRG